MFNSSYKDTTFYRETVFYPIDIAAGIFCYSSFKMLHIEQPHRHLRNKSILPRYCQNQDFFQNSRLHSHDVKLLPSRLSSHTHHQTLPTYP